LFFYLQDPPDVSANTRIDSATNTATFYPELHNGILWFVGISADEALASIKWTTTTNNDGYGLDGFSTVSSPVPEPATMLVLGSGLVGLLGVRKRANMK